MTETNQCVCKSTHIVKYGFTVTREGKIQKYQCHDCGRITYPKD